MAKDKKIAAADFAADDSGGWVTRFLADEDSFDRRTLWRLGSWATAAVGAVTIAVLANQSYVRVPRDQIASDVASQSRQIQRIASEAQVESKRLTSALETLNSDHDRLYSRIMTLEEGLDSITGSIARQSATSASPAAPKEKSPPHHAVESRATVAAMPPDPEPIPSRTQAATAVKPEPAKPEKVATPVVPPAPATIIPRAASSEPASVVAAASTPAIPTLPIPATPDVSLTKPAPPAAVGQAQPTPDAASETRQTLAAIDTTAIPEIPVRRTEFGVDLGGANSIEGLRTLWRRIGTANKELNGLSPIIAVQERHEAGRVHLRLVAGPFDDAAAAAKICAILATRRQACETSVFDGQRLALNAEPSAAPAPRAPRRRNPAHTVKREPLKPAQPAPAPAAAAPAR